MSKVVPNEFPTVSTTYRIALIGEAPGATEELAGRPFVGAAGRLLDALLRRAGILREACYIGNLCRVRPPGNEFARCDRTALQESLDVLCADLSAWRPNLIVGLGGAALNWLKSGDPLSTAASIVDWRGSLFASPLGKAMASYHPAYVLRDWSAAPLLQFDLRRAKEEGETPELNLPVRQIDTDLTESELLHWLANVRGPVAVDIEGRLVCMALAETPDRAVVIHRWTPALLREVARIMEDPHIPKIFQNALYDCHVLALYGIRVRNVAEDTMLKFWELYCELPKRLSVQTSLLTREPFYKAERFQDLFRYCGKDAAVTREIADKIVLQDDAHYRFNLALLEPFRYLQLRGIRFDARRAAQRAERVRAELYALQFLLNREAGVQWSSVQDLERRFAELYRTKRGPWRKHAPLDRWNELLSARPTLATLGEIETILQWGPNVASPAQMRKFLGTDASDYETMLRLWKRTRRRAVRICLAIRAAQSRLKYLTMRCDDDGRIRCSFNIVGTETGRVTSYRSITGSGFNLQTIPKPDRDLFRADDGYWFFQCDLAGADGWTVACHAARLGDRTMLEDYLAGIKPAKVLCLILRGIGLGSRDHILAESAKVKSSDWDYFACKRIQHGSSYFEGPRKISRQIFIDSEGRCEMSEAECRRLQQAFFDRYPGVKRWHGWLQRQLPIIRAASGQVRRFFGRDPLTEAAAFEPQANTTYATNLALLRLWRSGSCVEVLHQVHDAVCGQFPRDRTDEALRVIKECFNNPLTIAGTTVVIPFEGAYGPSWGELVHAIH